jgi:hypothetical protein
VAEVAAGRFVLIDLIGRGATGHVWRAFDTRERRYCAAKVFRRRNAVDLIRIVREQGVRLSHPYVVCPYAWTADDDDVVIAMDLMRGGSLSTLISDHGALPAPYAARILGQLLSALEHVHAAGLLHRDVKPGNILLEATGTGEPYARLADFGIAMIMGEPSLTASGVVLGTPGYLAPEAIEGAPPDRARDLYAAGVVGWQMLTGAEEGVGPAGPPDPAPPAGVPAELWSVVRSLCDPNPAARPRDARQAGALLARAAERLPLRLPARTAGGDPIEVFDQLGPLPGGFGPGGPLGTARDAGPAETPEPPAAPATRGDEPRGDAPPTGRTVRPPRGRTRIAAMAGLVAVLAAITAVAVHASGRDGGRHGTATARTPVKLKVMTWATCADGKPPADPGAANAICVNGRQTDNVAYGIRWSIRSEPGLQMVFLEELCSADLDRLRSLDGMSGWRFRFAAVLDQGDGRNPAAKAAPRPCHPQKGVSRGDYGIAVGVRAPATFDVHYYPAQDVPGARDRWGQWNVRQVAVCGTLPASRITFCGTQLTPLLGHDPAHPDAFWTAQSRQVEDLIDHAGTNGRVVVGGDLNSIAPDAAGGAGDRSPLAPLYRAYRECDQAVQGGARTGRGTYQHPDGRRGAKLDYIFTTRNAAVSCDVSPHHVKLSDQVPVTATIAFPAS